MCFCVFCVFVFCVFCVRFLCPALSSGSLPDSPHKFVRRNARFLRPGPECRNHARNHSKPGSETLVLSFFFSNLSKRLHLLFSRLVL